MKREKKIVIIAGPNGAGKTTFARGGNQRMKSKLLAADADLVKAGQALERAAARARQLAEQTGTPLYVFKDGRVVDLNHPSAGGYVLREEHSRK